MFIPVFERNCVSVIRKMCGLLSMSNAARQVSLPLIPRMLVYICAEIARSHHGNYETNKSSGDALRGNSALMLFFPLFLFYFFLFLPCITSSWKRRDLAMELNLRTYAYRR